MSELHLIVRHPGVQELLDGVGGNTPHLGTGDRIIAPDQKSDQSLNLKVPPGTQSFS